MKQFFYLSVFSVLVLSACTGGFKKGDNGIDYKIISKGSGKTISYGNFMQIHIEQIYGGTKDTVLLDTRETMPRIQVLDSVRTPLAYYKIISQLKKGDSLVIRLLTDTAFKSSPEGMPPFMKKGKYLYTRLKMVNFFETRPEADSANNAERALAKPRIYKKQVEEIEKDMATKKEQLAADDKIIQDYLLKNNITAQKTKWGTYVSIITEGTGEKMSSNNIATVNYTGRTLDSGKVFDSNIDPKFQHVEPYEVNLGSFEGIILGWPDALYQLKKGSVAKIFIPSSLAYGAGGRGAEIKPNEILVFDMTVVDVTTEEQAMAKQQEMQNKMMEEQKRISDSLQNATQK
ncbi:MAG: FKBP-type peptidyl-prolyl cis-trans isomerase [Ferruginibacter sp.]